MKVKRYLHRINKDDGLYDVPRWEARRDDYAICRSFSPDHGQWLGLPEKARHGEAWILTIEARPARKRRTKKGCST